MKKSFCFLVLLLFAKNAYCQLQPDKNIAEKYKVAIEEFNKANDSAVAEFYYKRGGIRQDYLDFEGAISDYDKHISFNPDNFKAYYNRGLSKMELMLFPEAVKDFDKAIDLNPSQDNAYNNRGICKFMQKKI